MKLMRLRLVALGIAVCLTASAAVELTVQQLVEFVSSSIRLNHRDNRVANYLNDVVLSERLDDETIRALRDMGAGARTYEALVKLGERSAQLPAADSPALEAEEPVVPAPSRGEQDRIIEAVRQYARSYTEQLPDFICTQVTRRYGDPSGLEIWRQLDTITARVSYYQDREDYQVVLIDNRPVDMGMRELGGATSTGEFGTMLRQLFAESTDADFRWLRWGKLRGRPAHVYEYRVARDRSQWSISYEDREHVIVGYQGLVFVDEAASQVLRITVKATEIPPSFPVQDAETVLDYDFVDISGREYLLPLKFDMRMRSGKLLTKNEVEFRMYRKFEAESVITFGTPDPLPPEMTTEDEPEAPSE